jgi:hypothetical protein
LAEPGNVHCFCDCCNRHSRSNLDKMGTWLTFADVNITLEETEMYKTHPSYPCTRNHISDRFN